MFPEGDADDGDNDNDDDGDVDGDDDGDDEGDDDNICCITSPGMFPDSKTLPRDWGISGNAHLQYFTDYDDATRMTTTTRTTTTITRTTTSLKFWDGY